MVMTWHRSDTYAHGFLILPFVIYMIWTDRNSLINFTPQPNLSALLGLCILGFFWLVAELASVQIVTQYAVVAMLPFVIAVILGYRIMFALAFPLAYLFFAVPFGEILIPPLINFTADFTVGALQLSGIPVYREGNFFSLPSGNWSVVEACSGLRYLIASVTLGTFYAYLTYRSLSKRLIFIFLSIIVPIFANGVRAYLIVMTGHLSDMTLAVGVDHLTYGWLFFGFIMLLLFWVGGFWREDKIDTTVTKKITIEANSASTGKTLLAACTVLIVSLIWPAYAAYINKGADALNQSELDFTFQNPIWHITEQPVSNWEPIYVGQPVKFQQHYFNDQNKKVSLFITYYLNQRQGDELINSGNVLMTENSHWRKINENKQTITINSRNLTIRETQINSFAINLLVWRWYILGEGQETTSPYVAKAMLAKNRLISDSEMGAEIIIATPYEIHPSEAKPVLKQFLADMLPEISSSLVAK